ncbi:NADH dehydrogenase subunit C [Pseudopedobacter saltans DSM 12145]|uniref:NADH-quinone oxidoreductase subunit C n=1 Tax=Pseudopedobacter saltans (strain ATCC 51119 / DSM 12145 / JCM 21818 / CCUG 39354 / LMG 10337 / NBRC 100064 / NCIMB 13643) TaxID=762903 RepID=F0S910_PSESL|nr:NADH-quinone oxidoreductase subunit C [Pseudopedobacter saltans]ADY53497.1 NADH dehydrogenase subunit C [Pseudopedobacter saltans DSM 12145]
MAKISNQQVIARLESRFASEISNIEEPYGLLTFETERSTILELLSFLKNDEELSFNYLTDLTAVHYPERNLALGVVYHLHSFKNNVRVRIKTFLPVSDPTIPTVTDLWNGANWMERETFDFFGIQFIGHPDLRRILNVDDMTVFPMRKEYPLEDPNRVDKKDYFFGR